MRAHEERPDQAGAAGTRRPPIRSARQTETETETETAAAAVLPRGRTAASITALQRTAGNAAVSRMLAAPLPVQRITEEEYERLHRHPPGQALRLRGPGRKFMNLRGGKPNQINDEHEWENITQKAAAENYPGFREDGMKNKRLDVHEDPTTLNESRNDLLKAIGQAALREGKWADGGLQDAQILETMGRSDPKTEEYWKRQDARAAMLSSLTATLGQQHPAEPRDRPGAGAETDRIIDATDTPLEAVQQLLGKKEHDGVLFGGEHPRSPFWGFAVQNMDQLKNSGVRTIYLESLRDDSHQRLVDQYLSSQSAEMAPELRAFAQRYDGRWALSVGMLTFLEEAKRKGMRVKGVNGMPARQRDNPNRGGLPSQGANSPMLHHRAAAMNTYAYQVVTRDRAGLRAHQQDPGKYLMELGAAHARTHRTAAPVQVDGSTIPATFPGLDALLQAPSVELHTPQNAKTWTGEKRIRRLR